MTMPATQRDASIHWLFETANKYEAALRHVFGDDLEGTPGNV